MNKKGNTFNTFIALIILGAILGAIFYGAWYLWDSLGKDRAYIKFCKERPKFCYCGLEGCTFKIQTSSSTTYTNGVLTNEDSGMSDDTIELCKLATRLNDKEMLFKIGC